MIPRIRIAAQKARQAQVGASSRWGNFTRLQSTAAAAAATAVPSPTVGSSPTSPVSEEGNNPASVVNTSVSKSATPRAERKNVLTPEEALFLAKEAGAYTKKELQHQLLRSPSFSRHESPFLLDHFLTPLPGSSGGLRREEVEEENVVFYKGFYKGFKILFIHLLKNTPELT